mmetsp:Transcript_28887/g.78250  ORF Transcript_28887/g.78250 Transcript_28887/m.78250 type:complete len:247 (-) Transcript_28887:397-1137(-)
MRVESYHFSSSLSQYRTSIHFRNFSMKAPQLSDLICAPIIAIANLGRTLLLSLLFQNPFRNGCHRFVIHVFLRKPVASLVITRGHLKTSLLETIPKSLTGRVWCNLVPLAQQKEHGSTRILPKGLQLLGVRIRERDAVHDVSSRGMIRSPLQCQQCPHQDGTLRVANHEIESSALPNLQDLGGGFLESRVFGGVETADPRWHGPPRKTFVLDKGRLHGRDLKPGRWVLGVSAIAIAAAAVEGQRPV